MMTFMSNKTDFNSKHDIFKSFMIILHQVKNNRYD